MASAPPLQQPTTPLPSAQASGIASLLDGDFRRTHQSTVARRTAAWFDRYARERATWRERNRFYYAEIARLAKRTIPPGARVLEIGCGIGDLLAAVQPSLGVGIDVSEGMLSEARRRHAGKKLHFFRADAHDLPVATTFDYVICSDLIGHLEDIQHVLDTLHRVCTPQTKIVITYWNFAWQVALVAAEKLGLKMPQGAQNWLGMADVDNLLVLTDYAAVERGTRLLFPKPLPVIGPFLNDVLGRLPFLNLMGLITHWVARPTRQLVSQPLSCSVIVPCRNEEENIDACVERLPVLGTHTEVIFVDGASTDRTRERILALIERYRGVKDIKLIDQVPGDVPPETAPFAATTQMPASGAGRTNGDATNAGGMTDGDETPEVGPVMMLKRGKGDAVRQGFAAASGDVLFILDSDLTVPPEELPKFLEPIAAGKAGFVNGTRLVYPMEDEAMMFHRMLGNKFFSLLFTWLLGQTIKDTLCGTKVMRKTDYERLAANRSYFGDFDPFGDFDLLFGAARLGLKIVEVPVRYRKRTFGYSKVNVLQHGPLLLRMSVIGFRRLKLQPWLARLRGQNGGVQDVSPSGQPPHTP